MREIDDDKYLFMATKGGMVKKTRMCEYSNMRKTGLQAILLREGDELIEVKVTDNTEDIFLATKFGMVYPLQRDGCENYRPCFLWCYRHEAR